MSDSTSKFGQEQEEPLFMAISQQDAAFQKAYAQASATHSERSSAAMRRRRKLPVVDEPFLP